MGRLYILFNSIQYICLYHHSVLMISRRFFINFKIILQNSLTKGCQNNYHGSEILFSEVDKSDILNYLVWMVRLDKLSIVANQDLIAQSRKQN